MAAPLLSIPQGDPYKPLQSCSQALVFETPCNGDRHSLVFLPKGKILILEDHAEALDPYVTKALTEMGKDSPACYSYLKAFRSNKLYYSGWSIAVFDEDDRNYNRAVQTLKTGVKSFWDMDNLADKLANAVGKEVGNDGSVIGVVRKVFDVLHSYDSDELKRELRRF